MQLYLNAQKGSPLFNVHFGALSRELSHKGDIPRCHTMRIRMNLIVS